MTKSRRASLCWTAEAVSRSTWLGLVAGVGVAVLGLLTLTARPPRGRPTRPGQTPHHAKGQSNAPQRTAPKGEQTPDPKGNLSIKVRVLDSEGYAVKGAQLVLWTPVRSGEDTPRWSRQGRRVYWHDSSSGLVWKVCAALQRGAKPAFAGLTPGEYRLTAAGNMASKWDEITPTGTSPIVQLDGAQMSTTMTVIQQQGECSLAAKVIDDATREPVKHASFLLVRSDGLPIARASTRVHRHTNTQGVRRYTKLTPGTYWLHDVKKRASVYGDNDYRTSQNCVRVQVIAAQENEVIVPVHAVALGPEEIVKRWPFVVMGRVTDVRERPLSGVRVQACSGPITMFMAGWCVSDEHGEYTLRFTGNYWHTDDHTGERTVAFQCLGVSASKPGYFERNMGRQGKLVMAEKEPARWRKISTLG